MGFLYSLGLMQRTKKGWHTLSVLISSSSERLNWLLSVGERFLVSAPCARTKTTDASSGRGDRRKPRDPVSAPGSVTAPLSLSSLSLFSFILTQETEKKVRIENVIAPPAYY